MSADEKKLVERILALPEPVQDKFLAQVQGAEIALDAMQQPDEKKPA